MSDEKVVTDPSKLTNSNISILKMLIPSALGIFIFFIPITINGRTSIPLDHMVNYLRELLGGASAWYALGLILVGAAYPIWTGKWKASLTDKIFSLLKILGLFAAVLAVTGWGPELLHAPNMLPFLFNTLVTSVGLIVPLGAIFLALLIGYGLLEFIGVLFQPLMRPLFRTPGRSAIDAVASFVGSYSIGLLITNRVYIARQYSAKEAVIIATGFSTVSATFMLVVARTLDLMSMWNLYFWLTLLVTFVVTAITVRLPPIRNMDDQCDRVDEVISAKERLPIAWQEGLKAASCAPPLYKGVMLNLREGLIMAISILPSIMSVGLIGLLIANHTPVFNWLGWIFYPFVAIWGIPEALEISRAAATGLAEMFLPALLMREAELLSRFVIGVVSVSSILFFSASIPCILSTTIPLSVPRIVLIWFIRVALSLLLAVPAGWIAIALAT